MKIADDATHLLEAPLEETFSWSFNTTSTRSSCVVEIVTDSGLTGWGECFGPAVLNAAVVGAFRGLLIGRDALAQAARIPLMPEPPVGLDRPTVMR